MMNDIKTIVGEAIGHRGYGLDRHRIIVKEDQTGCLFELDRFAAITPIDPTRSLIEYRVTRDDYKIVEGKRVRVWE